MYYKIKKNVLWRKELWNLILLLPKSKKLLTFSQEFSNNLWQDGIIKNSRKHKKTIEMLLNNSAIEKSSKNLEFIKYNQNKISAPLNLTLQITNNCNLKCIHCHRNIQRNKNISFFDIKNIIDQLYEMKVFNINVSWWEPLLHQDIIKIIKYISKKWMNVTMSSNLLLWNEEIVKQLATSWLRRIHVSLDSFDWDTHDKIRWIKWSFVKLKQNIKLLKPNNIQFTIVTTIINQSVEDYWKTIDLSYKLWANSHKTNTFIHQWSWKNFKKDIQDFKKYCQLWKNKKKYYNWKMNLIWETMFLIQIWKEYISPKWIPKILDCWCPAWILTCAINENWDVLACPFFNDLCVWNIHKQTFKHIRNNSPILQQIKQREKINICNKCEYLKNCWGCRARSYGLYNCLNKKDPLCFKLSNNIND